MSISKDEKRKALIDEFRKRAREIPVVKKEGNVLDGGYSGPFTDLWRWLENELNKLERESMSLDKQE